MATTQIQHILAALKKINRLAATLSGCILLFITISIFIDVFLRYFFNRPSIWITEVSTYLFLYIIFLGTAYALQEDMHIKVTFIVGFLGPRLTKIIDLLTAIFAMIFCLVLLWQTTVMTWTAFKEDWTSPTMLNAPYGYIYIIMVIGSFLLFLTFFFQTLVKLLEPVSESSK
jgi:TRAP-type C4-dicarboxylate transport system permease small subunit